MYYIIETENVGPNRFDPKHIDTHTFEIATKPATGNMDGQAIEDGWCGTTNDWSVNAHGAFETQDEAEQTIQRMLQSERFREDDLDDRDDIQLWQDEAKAIVARYRPGKYTPLSSQTTNEVMGDDVIREVDAAMDDDALRALLSDMITGLNAEHACQPDEDTLWQMLRAERDDKREQRSDSE